MDEILKFIASPTGKKLRVIAGITLIGAGMAGKRQPNWLLAAVGLVPLSAGLFDKCVLAPLVGKPFSGEELREQLNS